MTLCKYAGRPIQGNAHRGRLEAWIPVQKAWIQGVVVECRKSLSGKNSLLVIHLAHMYIKSI